MKSTRLGLLVNAIRKKCAQTYPEISKQCRNLIKEWQKLLQTASSTGAGGHSSNSAASSPAGSLTTPRAVSKLAAVGLMCSPSPALHVVGKGPGNLTPKLANVVVNGTVRSNSNSPKIVHSPSISKNNSPHIIQSNSYAPSTTTTAKGPSPLVLYSSSSSSTSTFVNNNNNINTVTNNINNSETVTVTNERKSDSKSCSPTTVANISSSSSSSTTNTTSSLKIRFKVSGDSDSVSIVKPVDSSLSPPDVGDVIVVNNKEKLIESTTSYNNKDLVFDGGDKKLTNGLTNATNLTSVAADDGSIPSTSAAETVVGGQQQQQQKKPRQKRQLDQSLDSSDPLSILSKGGPLPKCKTTTALVAEMARVYPEEMAKSITNATLEISPDLEDDDFVDRTSLDANFNKRGAAACPRRGSSETTGFYYAKHDDYLDITKSEMVAHYLKTSVEDDDGGEPRSPYSPSYVPPSSSSSTVGDLPVVRRRGRPRKNVADVQIYSSTFVVGSSKSSTEKRPDVVVSSSLTGSDHHQNIIQPVAVKPKKIINWYDVLPPLKETSTTTTTVKEEKEDKQFLDYFYPHEKTTLEKPSSSTSTTRPTVKNEKESFPNLHSRILSSIKDRRVLAMPYVDIGLPDFVEYRYPDSDRFVAHWSER